MAVGDVKNGISNVNQSSYLAIQPASAEEWNLRTVVHTGNISIEFYNGSNSIIFETTLPSAGIYYCHIDMTNTIYIRVKNIESTSQYIGYSARQIK